MLFDPYDPLGPGFTSAIEDVLSRNLAARLAEVMRDVPPLGAVVDLLTHLAIGGKHIRPAFVWWSYVAVAGEPDDPIALLNLAASLDITHAGLLAHDDLIDAADIRRGQPSVHQAIAALSRVPDPALGVAGAVVGGAWLLQWSQQCFDECGLAITPAARAVFNSMRTRVLTGQMADAWAAAGLQLGTSDPAHLIDDLKTASYTVVGPTQLGALLAGGDVRRLQNYAAHLGRAYQARDDVLGIFGMPADTGKPVGDDLRRGKMTSLVQAGLKMATPDKAEVIQWVLRNPASTDGAVAAASRVIAECGALASVEQAIADDLFKALTSLDGAGLKPAGRAGLETLARVSASRTK